METSFTFNAKSFEDGLQGITSQLPRIHASTMRTPMAVGRGGTAVRLALQSRGHGPRASAVTSPWLELLKVLSRYS